jgi:PHP family Zn ribbon phosphoesterase
MLGSKSGFDSLTECFGDLSRHITAVETGLSSDPPMNWRVGSLDRVALVSNSDLHSPGNLARNANLFHGEPDFFALLDGLARRDPAVCGGTIDLFPEEGKYHLDGHRACGVVFEPEESLRNGNLCPVCGRELTLGVLHRVNALADRPAGQAPAGALPHQYIIPLPELLGEIVGTAATSRKVNTEYLRLLQIFGPEMDILLSRDPDDLAAQDAPRLAEAIRRVRAGRVQRQGGYDGAFGVIRVFTDE